MFTFPAGEYYIGDPCYVIPEADWEPLLEETNFFQRSDQFYRGKRIFVANTAHGDGVYTDNYNQEYFVDAGSIGIIPVELIERGQEHLGVIVKFDGDFQVGEEDGDLFFGHIVIVTNFNDEDEEDYDDYMYDDYDDDYDEDYDED